MTSSERLRVRMEYLFFGGILVGQIIAFLAGAVAGFFMSSEVFQTGPALLVWLLWMLVLGLFLHQGIRESLARKPTPDRADSSSGLGSA